MNACKHYNRDVRGWIASGDIIMHEEFCQDCGISVYRRWHYNDGLFNSSRDTLTRVEWDYRPIATKPPESEAVSERKAVNEVIEAEKLTVDEILDRMPDGWTLVSSEHFDSVVNQKNDNYEQILRLEKEIRYRTAVMVDCAALLASAGGYEHKTKNEFILRVIDTLLTYREAKRVFSAKLDDEDIPF